MTMHLTGPALRFSETCSLATGPASERVVRRLVHRSNGCEHMTSASWKRLVVIASVVFVCSACFGFQLFFAPGWANGWPFGLTVHSIWSVGIAFIVFALLMALAIGVGAFVGLLLSLRGIGSRLVRSVYITWLLIAATSIMLVSMWIYQGAHASALHMWPNGYPNRQAR